ncbi:hypothetical protein [uncultured Rikenella sp.]|uniref:hypothetical protein n=1 Tax=uncultured Rikenella sp. TaxID=368003 RepID=UPI00260AA754|nr:hypothetical protein [uncultured Rikenella sp.]
MHMKRILLGALLALGLTLGSTSALLAGNPADAVPASEPGDTAAVEAPADTLTVLAVPAPTVAAADSLLQALGERLAGVEQAVGQMRNISYSRSGLDGDNIQVVLVMAVIAAVVVLTVFFSLKYRFRRHEKKYELERMRIERGEQPVLTAAKEELPVTTFIRRLLIFAIVGFTFLAWVGVVNLSYMRFFSAILLWALIAGVGYAVVYLFRQYVQRRDDNR